MAGRMDSVWLQFPDVLARIASNQSELVEHIRRQLAPLVRPPAGEPHVSVAVHWREGNEPPASWLEQVEHPDVRKIGKRLYRVGEWLVWSDVVRTKNLGLRFRLTSGQLEMACDYRFQPSRKKLEQNPHYRSEKYFSLLKYFVYFPVLWYGELFLSRFPLHASGIVLPGGAVAIGGVGGVGKTTTSMALFAAHRAQFLSENIILYDTRRFYQFYEPIRLDDHSLSLLGEEVENILERARLPEGTREKNLFHLRPERLSKAATARVVLLPEFAPQTQVQEVPAPRAVNLIHQYNLLTRELNDYYWFAAAAGLLRPERPLPEERIAALRQLLRRVPVYRLDIDRRKGIPSVMECIQQLFQEVFS